MTARATFSPGSLVLLEALLLPIVGENNDLAIVISTLLIAALFLPLRRTIQMAIDRRFYRRKYDAARTVEAFGATLRGEVDLNKLAAELVEAVEETMQPAHVSLRLQQQPKKGTQHMHESEYSYVGNEDRNAFGTRVPYDGCEFATNCWDPAQTAHVTLGLLEAEKEFKVMTLSRLIRWSGMAFLVSGILLIVVTLLHPDVFQTTFARATLDTPWWVHIHVLTFIYTLLALLGTAGIYLRQVEKAGVPGFVGFLMVFVGLIAVAGLAMFEAFVMPALATGTPAALSWDGPLLTSPLFYVGTGLVGLYPLGFVLLGIATMRAGVLSRRGALLLTLGAPLTAVFEGAFVPFLGIASVVVLAAGQAWLGYDLWAARSRVATRGKETSQKEVLI